MMVGLVTSNAYSQPAFSLIRANKMVFNPAFTGLDTAFKHQASLFSEFDYNNPGNYQYVYSSSIATFQMGLDKINSGVGIMVNYSYISDPFSETDNQLAAKLYYRYTFLPGLSIGIDAGVVDLKSHYQYGPIMEIFSYVPYTNATINNFDFDGGAGILYQRKSFYAGVTIDHITSPKSTYPDYIYYTEGPMLYYSGISYNWIVGSSLRLGHKTTLDFYLSYRSNITDLNLTFRASHFFIGISTLFESYTYSDMLINTDFPSALMCGLNLYHNKLKISFAYDIYTDPYYSAPFEGGISFSY